ncbi:hypothetical protein FNV43_RR11335 [Rhamnella rubrinervis]|uniref:Pentatricopeptide repeat-containing protein n=1 Tax=Rhamnella rubrinervis TaxID=2594499 RepID=A0A8K0H5L6_9ROSA|nr:hypothetical protein FNV43_RR11335 [Rhamnella rubrinervis]
MGYAGSIYSRSALLDMYAKCVRVKEAYVVFKHMSERKSGNALIAGYVQVGDQGTAFWLFSCMKQDGLKPGDGTLAPLLTLLDDADFYKSTMQIHGKSTKLGLEFSSTVCNPTIPSYSECGSIGDAKTVFGSSFGTRDVVTWNSMLAAYLVPDKEELAYNLFMDMQRLGFEPQIK